MQLNNFKYSYAASVGHFLQAPLFQYLTENSTTRRVAIISVMAFSLTGAYFAGILLPIIPAVLFLGYYIFTLMPLAIFSPLDLAGKCIKHFSYSKLNYSSLSKIPPSIQLPEAVPSDLQWLKNRFNDLYPNTESKFLKMCDECNSLPNATPSPGKLTKYDIETIRETQVFLSNIESKLKEGNVPTEIEKMIFTDLARESNVCHAAWHIAASNIYDSLYQQAETAEVRIIKIFQRYKEALICEALPLDIISNIHIHNDARNKLSEELGLSQRKDPFLDPNHPNNKGIKALFQRVHCSDSEIKQVRHYIIRNCNDPNRLTKIVQDAIIESGNDHFYYDFLRNILEKNGVSSEQSLDFITKNLYTDDYKITFEGVNMMLKEVGILQ